MPVRKIPLKYTSLSGEIPSKKNNRSVAFESSLEADFIILLEFDSRVSSFEEQPFLIEFIDTQKKLRTYTPDFLVHFRKAYDKDTEKPIIYEVKYTTDLIKKEATLKEKFEAAHQFCKEMDYNFKIITEKEIRGVYLNNIKFLKRYRGVDIHWPKASHLIDLLKKFKICSVDALVAASSSCEEKRAMFLYVLWYLMARGLINCNLQEDLTMSTNIWLSPII